MRKHKNRTTQAHKQKENKFVDKLEDLFDIAHANALTKLNPEDQAFLLTPRKKGRPGAIGPVDRVYVGKMKRKEKRLHAEVKRQKLCTEELEVSCSQATLYFTSEESETTSESDSDPIVNQANISIRKNATKNVITSELTAALDRTKTSSRNATYILREMATSLGHNISDINIKRNSIQHARVMHRSKAAENLKLEFDATVPLTVHWDGKLMEDITKKKHIDRLPILVSGAKTEKLLVVPKLTSGIGASHAETAVKCLDDWHLRDQVVALSFDTTASNTGHRSGACTLIEEKLEKDVLHFPCRHHIMELTIGSSFEKVTATSTGPEIQIFKQFQQKWLDIDHDRFAPANTDTSVEVQIASCRNDLVNFICYHLEFQQPRNDYKEFLELSFIYLGEIPARGIHFQAPGAMHRARWMAKVIYSIKMWLFRKQLIMTHAELHGIRDVAIFAVKVYLKAWITAPCSTEAPLNGFTLMRSLLEYPHTTISVATSHKLGLHLWFISEELVTLALFDSRLLAEEKALMVSAMKKPAPKHPPKRPRVETSAFLGSRRLDQFCTANSIKFFKILGLSEAFLTKDPATWCDDEDY